MGLKNQHTHKKKNYGHHRPSDAQNWTPTSCGTLPTATCGAGVQRLQHGPGAAT